MDLKKLLSVNMATLAALAALLLAMGQRSPETALAAWMAAIVSLVVTDFTGWFRLDRAVATLAALAILGFFLRYGFRYEGEARILAMANLLIYIQLVLLFQEKDERVYWWLAMMSLLQVVVAAGFCQGLWFGALLVVYMLLGLSGTVLLLLFSEWDRHGHAAEQAGHHAGATGFASARGATGFASARSRPRGATAGLPNRAPGKPIFTSTPAGGSRAGVVGELFARLGLTAVGTLALTLVIFFTVPRLGQPAWRGIAVSPRTVVGFNDKVALGEMGEILESRDEVMRVQLVDRTSGHLVRVADEIYLRGAVVTHYKNNAWSCPPEIPRQARRHLAAAPSQIVVERITVEPLDRDELFCIWPVVEPVRDRNVMLDPTTDRLLRSRESSQDLRNERLSFELETTGLSGGRQTALIPCEKPVDVESLLQLPALPRLGALANRWMAQQPSLARRHAACARFIERKLATTDQFHYSLQGQDRDLSIDAIEDFVSNHPVGHCEYFATALALMLRSQGIASRVVLGYRCDEWNEAGKFYQVRQLHAHAWVEAYLEPEEIPAELRQREGRRRWSEGGWLRLDPTPAADIGTIGADSSTWGQWQSRLHRFQSAWDDYVVEMDRQRQREAVFQPMIRAVRKAASNVIDPQWWRAWAGRIGDALVVSAWSSLGGWLLGVGLPLAAVMVVLGLAVWGAWRPARQAAIGSGCGSPPGKRRRPAAPAIPWNSIGDSNSSSPGKA